MLQKGRFIGSWLGHQRRRMPVRVMAALLALLAASPFTAPFSVRHASEIVGMNPPRSTAPMPRRDDFDTCRFSCKASELGVEPTTPMADDQIAADVDIEPPLESTSQPVRNALLPPEPLAVVGGSNRPRPSRVAPLRTPDEATKSRRRSSDGNGVSTD